jgi:hypothetical protein
VLAANEAYAGSFCDKSELALPPARGFAILTCMDARLDPAQYAGLSEGDAHVIRNAGGWASDDAIGSLVISHKLLGTKERGADPGAHPLVPGGIPIYGYLYDVTTGRLVEVPEATKAGLPI